MNTHLPYTLTRSFAHLRDEAEVDTLMNNDIYKFLMLDFILTHPSYRDILVRWKMTVRDPSVHLAHVIPIAALRDQLDATRAIAGFSPADVSYLGGMKTQGGRRLFRDETLEFLRHFRLPDYRLELDGHGGYDLSFEGKWCESMMWEIPALKIVNSLYLSSYAKRAHITPSEWTRIMTTMMGRLYHDIDTVKRDPRITFSEFGTRRAASTDIHRQILDILENELPDQCVGTSNVMLARERGNNNPRGTNAHELRMIPTACTDTPEAIVDTMYEVDRQWMKHFPELAILLPDTFGSTFYFEHAPRDIVEGHTGCRFDSKHPTLAIPEYIDWLMQNGKDPKKKIGIPSDGLESETIRDVTRGFHDKIGTLTYGWGTTLTNNTRGLFPQEKEIHGPWGAFSLVIKPDAVWRPDRAEWVSCVKLSDNPNKAMGSRDRVDLFQKTFGVDGMRSQEVRV